MNIKKWALVGLLIVGLAGCTAAQLTSQKNTIVQLRNLLVMVDAGLAEYCGNEDLSEKAKELCPVLTAGASAATESLKVYDEALTAMQAVTEETPADKKQMLQDQVFAALGTAAAKFIPLQEKWQEFRDAL